MKKLIEKFSWGIIAICLVLTVFFGLQLRKVSIENTVRIFMPNKTDSYKTMLKTEDDFGSMIGLGISLETKSGSIITPANIAIIKDITDKVSSVKNVEDVDSLTNIDYIYGENGSLVAGNLLGGDAYTGSDEDMKTIKQKIVDWQEMYNRVILNDAGTATQIMIQIQPKDENGKAISSSTQTALLHEVQKIAEDAVKGTDLEVRFFGDPVLTDDSSQYMLADLKILIPFVVLIVLLSLYFSFHTFAGTILPLITVIMSTIWACGLMAMMNITFTIVSSVIPVALIACGSAYGIHVLTHYYVALNRIEGEITKENHLDAIMWGLKDVWVAVLLAAITTVAGFISNVTSPIIPLRTFSVFTAIGVTLALLLSVILIPAMLYVTPINRVGKHAKSHLHLTAKIKARIERKIQRRSGKTAEEQNGDTLYQLYHFFAGTKPRLIVFVLAICVLSWAGIKNLVVDTALVNYFPPDSKFRQDISYVDSHLAGTNSMYLVISGQNKGDMTNPEILHAVDNLQNHLLENHKGIGKIVSFTTFIKRMNQVMHVPSANAVAPAAAPAQTASSTDSASDFGFDFGDASAEPAAAAAPAAPVKNFVDPNIENAKTLNTTMTVQEGLELLNKAYAAAGGKRATVEQIVDELEKSLNYNGSNYYEIPYDTSKYPAATRAELGDLVTQYLYLLSSDKITKFADDMTQPKSIRTQIELRSHSTDDTGAIIKDAQDYAAKYFPKDADGKPLYTLKATGNGEMEYTMTGMVISSQMVSIVFSLVMVFLIIAISFKSAWAGLLGAIPLGLTILLNFMVMGFAGIHLDLVTSIVASVAIGVGIDYTIHFMESYEHERAKSNDLEQVTRETFKTSGKGIVTNALAVGLGFLVLLFSKFIILRYIGVLIAIVMFTSSALAMTLIPGVLNMFDPRFMWTDEQKKEYKEKISADEAK